MYPFFSFIQSKCQNCCSWPAFPGVNFGLKVFLCLNDWHLATLHYTQLYNQLHNQWGMQKRTLPSMLIISATWYLRYDGLKAFCQIWHILISHSKIVQRLQFWPKTITRAEATCGTQIMIIYTALVCNICSKTTLAIGRCLALLCPNQKQTVLTV